jgi:hypothetical protein
MPGSDRIEGNAFRILRREAAESQHQKGPSLSRESAVECLRHHCATLSTLASKIVASQGFVTQNRLVCSDELKHFRSEVEPALSQALAQSNAALSFELREQVAVCLGNIACDHMWADERTTAEKLILEAVELAQGTWAAVSLQKKSLQIRYAIEGPWWEDSPPEISAEKRIYQRIGIGAAIAAMLLVFLVVDNSPSRTVAARPLQTSGPLSAKISVASPAPAELPIDFQLETLEVRIDIEKEHVASLEKQMAALHLEVESLKEHRALGAPIDSARLNVELYKYASLHRESRAVWAEINTDIHKHDQVVAQHRLLLKRLSGDGGNTQ